ncbi:MULTISPECIES: Lrp/AsnC family transcriptional regulator [unclassified Rhodococcus (in: high G+C Gram-positive bacteria)]|uniref:Lrp/AsnC family transcriptional regulator n=1 Tax=unclassified Rhodococcus (in: high G+C Gram-positive bacteria) TaxID=192944 RepID=UPI00163AC9EB|nr:MULTISPECIES: Lrp/AsnC family transcriptional regulator [unclassified Rhodococcus (in: high G+C Gram-positive bacteria)]MBC2643388.1 Lrp/AsnC family transcriptional regulator [Rhodococcus sp. 3A]MBC2891872.1 Lrp/AsnC family transcriptional regulator [Rhodococcus sp. 4CII]
MDDSLRMDVLDRRIVARLERNARSSFATIGADVGLSAPAVKRRVDRLVESGVITGFHAALDPRALGQGVEVFVELYCSGRTSAVEIARIVSRHTEVQEAYTVTGDANALLRVRTTDTAHLERTLENLRSEPAVLQTKSSVVLSRLIPPVD